MSSERSKTGIPSKISEKNLQIFMGILLGIATTVAVARVVARYIHSHRIDGYDGFFFLALTTLISGTTILYLDIPYIFLQENVEAGTEAPPSNLKSLLVHSAKLQYAAATLLGTAIMSVKLCFLFFFRGLARKQKRLMMWWWLTLAIFIPSAPFIMFSSFMSCPYFDDRILVKCASPRALTRENRVLQVNAVLDIITDVLLISIPIALLWHVQISLRRKVALCTVLCLSIFTIITAVIRIAGGNISQGQVDSAWVNFWEQAEAAVAIIVVSVSAFRALYVAHRASKQNSPFYPGFTSRSLWSKISKSRNNLPDVPSPSFTGVRTFVQRAPYGREILRDSPDMELPLRGSRIVVTRDVSTETTDRIRATEKASPSFF